MPRKHAVPTLKEEAFLASTNLIINSVNNVIKYIYLLDNVDEHFEIAKRILVAQEIKQYFNSMIPESIQNDISIFCLKTQHQRFNHRYNVLLRRITETIFNTRAMAVMTRLDIPEIVVSFFVRHLPCMFNLRVLKLEINKYDKFPPAREVLSEGVLCMPHLEEFAFEFSSDAIIEKIALHCKKIQKINVTGSKEVTNACIPALCMCEQLKEFQFYGSAITKSGYENLLIKHPRLETVDLIYLRPQEYVTVLSRSENEYFESTLYMRDLTLNKENVRKLSSMHPHITTLHILFDQISILSMFPNVQRVSVRCYYQKICFDELQDTMKLIGSTIKSLHFSDVTIDLKTLFIVNRYCPNIIHLKINHFTIESPTPIEELRFMKFEPFRSTTEICLTGLNHEITGATRQFFTYLLSCCTNIKSIFIDGCDLDDEIMKQVILSNPMKQLENLIITGETQLTMNSVNLLMEHCDNLWYLQKVEQWDISPRYLDRFRKHLKSNNINIITEEYNINNSHDIRETYRIDQLHKRLRKRLDKVYNYKS